MSEGIKRKRGRPKKGLTRNGHVSVRLTSDELDMLESMCIKRGETKTDIISAALRTQYNLFKFQD